MNLSTITPWWPAIKLCLFIAVCAGCYVYGGSNAKARAQLVCMKAQAAADTKAQAKSDDLNERLRKALQRPSVAQGVERAVSENPSNCRLPDAVTKRLQDGIAEANSATE